MKKNYLLVISIISYVFVGAVNHNVTTVGNTFSPANITINLGDTVTWTNGGGSHNVNATLSTYPNNPEGFGNSINSSSWSFQHIFSIAGTYDYQCDPHTSMGMVGTVTVLNSTSDITFKVDMSQYSGSQGPGYTVNLNGNFNGWCGNCNPMTDADNDSVWEITLPLTISDTIRYKFTVNGWSDQENFVGGEPCTNTNSGGFTDRQLIIPSLNTSLNVVCFNSCSACLPSSAGFTSELFFSEYAEGSSNNKYLEIYNGTGVPVDLSNYVIMQNSNGGPWDEYTDVLSGTLANGDVYVIANSSADSLILAEADLTGSGICFFNGDDARALIKVIGTDTTVCDYIGEFPTDPGTGWDVAGITNGTKEHTIVRKSTICNGDTSWSNSAGTDSINSQWIVLAQNDWTHLGSHSTNCTSQPPPPVNLIDITFTVNVVSIINNGGTIDSTGIFLAGGGTFGNPGDNPMTDLGNGIWSITVSKPVGFNSNYIFTNGDSGWGAKENISGLPCAVGPYDDRNLAPVYSDTTIQHCFGTCDYDGTCPPPPTSFVDITFNLNTSSIIQLGGTVDSTGIFIAGGGTFGNPGDNPMTDLGNDVWSITFTKPSGFTSDYTFTNGNSGWGAKEDISGLPCAVAPFSDRNLAPVFSDTTIQHCFGTCDYDGTCNSVIIPPTAIKDVINNVLIYPNPVNNILNISSSEIIKRVEVLDVVGRKVITKTLNSLNYHLDLSNLNSNVYFINYTINGVVNTKKVVVKN